jgi:lysozyme family protein
MMADFQISYQKTLINEGGWTEDPHPTWRGIDRHEWPGWPGWPLIDAWKTKPNFPATLKTDKVLAVMVSSFYMHCFWSKYYDQMPQELADKVYDRAVNAGSGTAIRLLQRACGVTDDGILGNQTMNAIASQDTTELVEKFKQESIDHYKAIVAANPSDARFLASWISRC